MEDVKLYQELIHENEALRQQLHDANDTIEAIRNGEVDALIVEGKNGHELFTLNSADRTYRTFIEQMSEGAVTLNPDRIIVYCNSSFANMVGQLSRDVISSPFDKFVRSSDPHHVNVLIDEGWNRDVKGEIVLDNNGRHVPVQLSITSLNMDNGKALSVIVTDLSSQKEILNTLKVKNRQLKEMNYALESSNHDLQQFASVASHDLQEPLRKIQVFSHLLKDKFSHELSEAPNNYLAKIMHSANRMKVLIVDILNYSRLSSKDNNYVRTDIKSMIQELLLDLELTIREKNARITVSDFPPMEVNPGQMRQVFQNLISNALKFSKNDVPPVIDIFFEYAQEDLNPGRKLPVPYCHIHVKDNGIGFDEKFSKSIFNLFEKLHSKDDYDGSGIGLAITKKIIEKHRGYINVISQVGVGTEFIMSLPIKQADKH